MLIPISKPRNIPDKIVVSSYNEFTQIDPFLFIALHISTNQQKSGYITLPTFQVEMY